MTNDLPDELSDLESLLAHPGWQRFSAYALSRWGPESLMAHVKTALNDKDDAAAVSKLRQAAVASDQILTLLNWPEQRVKMLNVKGASTVTQMADELNFSRRGRN